MKKIFILVVLTTLTTFMAASMVSAEDNQWKYFNPWKYFHGTYEMIASGSCLHSEKGYTTNAQGFYTPNSGIVYVGTTVASGTWIFKYGGTKMSSVYKLRHNPAGRRCFHTCLGACTRTAMTSPFTFVITPFGDITVTAGGINLIGSISIDKKTMTLLSANQVQVFGPPLWSTICNTARTLIKVGN